MKLLILSRQYPSDTCTGGIATRTQLMSTSLADFGYEVHVLCCSPQNKYEDDADYNVQIHKRPVLFIKSRPVNSAQTINIYSKGKAFLGRILTGISNWYWYKKIGLNFDIVIYPDTFAEGWVFALLKPTLLVSHDSLPLTLFQKYAGIKPTLDTFLAEKLEKIATHRADQIIQLSEYYTKLLSDEKIERNPKKIRVIYNHVGIDPHYSTYPVSDTKPIILFIGHLYQLKAPEILIEAINILDDDIPEIKGLFIGKDTYKIDGSSYLDWLHQNYDCRNCEFIGFVPHNKIKHHIYMSRVYVNSSRIELSSHATQEAMASARPIIITSKHGLTEIIQNNHCGVVIPPDNPVELANALLPLMQSAQYAQQIGLNAQKTAATLFNSEKVTLELDDLFRSMVQSKNASQRSTM